MGIEDIINGSQLDNLFDENEDIGFDDIVNETNNENNEDNPTEENKENKEDNKATEDNPDNEDNPEDVGSDNFEDIKDKEDTPDDSGTTPNKNLYSSITTAFAEEGIFPNLSEDDLKDIDTPEKLVEVMNKEIDARMDERTKRVESLLNGGVEPSIINQYENAINYINNIDEDTLIDEGEQGENLRKNIIYQDYINRGFSKQRAEKMLNKSIEEGTDIDDAKEALESCKDFYTNKYKELQDEARANEAKIIKEREAKVNKVKTSILNDEKLIGDVQLDKQTRQRISDVMFKPIHKDDNGNLMTELQKYQQDKPDDFFKNVGIAYAMTNGFKDWSKLGKAQAKKEVKKGLKHLETVINTTKNSGNLNFTGDFNEDNYFGKGVKLDL